MTIGQFAIYKQKNSDVKYIFLLELTNDYSYTGYHSNIKFTTHQKKTK